MQFQRESIFVSSLRSFARFFFAVCGIFLAVGLCSFLYSMVASPALTEMKTTLEVLPNAEGDRSIVAPTAPAILQVNIEGVIGDPNRVNTKSIENILLDSQAGLLQKGRVRGILLYFNTPGGAVVDSDNIYRMLQDYKAKYKVPIYGYVDGMCASGGMYIACSTDKIFASPASIIGSVGVLLGPFMNFYEGLQKIGVTSRTLTQGIDKDMMSPFRPWKEGEDASLKNVMGFFYQRFVDLVAGARPKLDKTKLINQYGAQVFNCVEAESLGYIDEAMSNREAALTALLQAAGVDPAQPYQVVELTPKKDWVAQLVQGSSPLFTGKVTHTVDTGDSFLKDQCAYLYQP